MKKPTAIIVHRWEKSPKGDWYPWLAKELRKAGWKVVVPNMPNPNAPELAAWVKTLEKAAKGADERTYFVGHSIGCQTIARVLAQKGRKVGGAVFVSPWFTLKDLDKETNEIARPWEKTPFNAARAKRSLGKSLALSGDTDMYLPVRPNLETWRRRLGSQTFIVKGANHFRREDGYTQLPFALGWLVAAAA